MINDLQIFSTKTSDWKYVDDITFSEVVQENGTSESQLLLDNINSRSVANDMRLNPSKYKGVIIFFSNTCNLPSALSMGQVPLERVECHKVLGLPLQSNLGILHRKPPSDSTSWVSLNVMALPLLNFYLCTNLCSLCTGVRILPRCGTLRFQLSFHMNVKSPKSLRRSISIIQMLLPK